ncbi:MAG: YbaN family protein [Defluviitaleaceae bacterium]|nr:YbaN family protein [Defluviitaleaceae bacterium]
MKPINPAKYTYAALGLFFLGMGAAGILLPLIPTTPFVLLAAICFGKSSDRLNSWFISTRLYKNNIEGLAKKKTMTIKSKLTLLAAITALMGISFFVMHVASAPFAPRVILVVIWLLHVLYFGFKIKTKLTS